MLMEAATRAERTANEMDSSPQIKLMTRPSWSLLATSSSNFKKLELIFKSSELDQIL